MKNNLEKSRREGTDPARESMEHLYRSLLSTPPFKLADGTIATVEAFVPPEVNESGELLCGVDVRPGDQGHLEFMLRNTGWGRAMIQQRAQPARRRRER